MSASSPRYSFSSRRTRCPECGASHGFSALIGSPGAGKCHACNVFIPPSRKAEYGNEGLLKTRVGSVIDLHARPGPKDDKGVVPFEEVVPSLLPLVRSRAREDCADHPGTPECDPFDELAAKFEYESGKSRAEVETLAALELGFIHNNSNSSMLQKIHEEVTLLRREHPFLATITELTSPTILSEWHVGMGDGAILFWYVDREGRFRNAKRIWYDKNGWNRSKDRPPHFLYKGCSLPLYGEWQLTPREHRPFALFESEKTALVASVHLPQYVCLAVGGHELKNEQKARVLAGRSGIILFDREPETIASAEQAAQTIRRAGADAQVENLEHFYPGIPAHWDVADIIYDQFEQWKETHS